MILIDNMEMPNNCAECRFWSVCHVLSEYPDYESVLTNGIIGENGKRHPNCPLHEVDDMPMVSAERTGKWIAYGDIPAECPFCHEDWGKYVYGDIWYNDDLPNYCPNCGERLVRE